MRGQTIEVIVNLQSDLAEVPRLMEAVTAFCGDHGLGADLDSEIQLVLEEAVTNSIRHGSAEDEDHNISVRMVIEPEALLLEVTDHGIPFDPLERAPVDVDAPLEERTIGGLGIHLIRSLMDEVEYERIEDRNRLRMRKALGQA
jgi:anti-sigma regulatory factor (Ser/Thr protein kinase)